MKFHCSKSSKDELTEYQKDYTKLGEVLNCISERTLKAFRSSFHSLTLTVTTQPVLGT